MRGHLLACLRTVLGGDSRERLGLFRADRVDGVARDKEDPTTGDRGPAKDLFGRSLRAAAAVRAVWQFHRTEDFGTVGQRTDDEKLPAVGAYIKLAVGQDRRRLLRSAERLSP